MNKPLILMIFILSMTALLAAVNPATAIETPATATEPSSAGGNTTVPLIQKLKGHNATVRAEELRVDQLLQAIGRQAGINIVVAGDITDTISFDVRDISFYEVFHFIMETRQLRYRQLNNVILVEKEKVKAETAALQQELLTVRVCPRYGQASEFIEQLRPLVSTTTGGSINVTSRGACLMFKDRVENLRRLEELLIELDRPVPQVHIEARIVTVTNEAKKRLGVNWDYNNLSTRNPLTATALTLQDPLTTDPYTNITFGFLRDNLDLNVKLQAMQNENLAELLSAPSVLVLNGEEAIIKQGQEVPYTSSTAAGTGVQTNTSFREATLSLKVTPRVIQDAFVNLKVHVTNDSVATNLVGDQPLIDKQEINTRLFLKNGATVVIGGILKKNKSDYSNQVPGLGDVPILGHLFKSNEKEDSKRELLVFITTTVVNLEQLGEAENTNPDYIRKEFGLHKDNIGSKGGT
ncbi:MAG: hypothetical protein A2520_03940 [Deltaproteobacteria bacterium RIFOXYD12_FULL_53_23]|nr:MAG: hypothetical protein A2520_03940 [Deltaproteobacteria bacterium RIFOXYD12_FULL_53_23]